MNLPPLPYRFDTVTRGSGCVNVWSEDDLRAYAEQAMADERDAVCAMLMRMHEDAQQSLVSHNYFAWVAHRLRENDHRK